MTDARGKARKNYRLTQSKLDVAQRVLGTRTETETLVQALDLVGPSANASPGARSEPWGGPGAIP